MFVATLSNGKTVVEGKDIEHFDACPDGITSMQLLMPYVTKRQMGNQILQRNAIVTIGRYDRYYCAKQAIANVMSFGGGTGQMMQGGQGVITHEILAGIDLARNQVLYLELNVATGDVVINMYNYDKWLAERNINPSILKLGAPKK